MNKEAGRPTKWRDNMPQILMDYYDECKASPLKFPKVSELCIRLGITRETLNQWLDESDRLMPFSDTFKLLKLLQEDRLIDKGLDKRTSPAFEIFLLKANHNLRETSAIDITSKDEKMNAGIFVGDMKGDNN